jgi:hypothetical protein
VETKRLRQAIRLWKTPGVPKHTQRHNQRAWLRMVNLLGEKWLVNRPRTKDQLKPQEVA